MASTQQQQPLITITPPAADPSTWDVNSRSPSMRYLDISGLRVRYKGPGSDDRDAAAIRTNHPVPPSCPLYYFEVEIVNKGRDGFIGIGFSVSEVKLDRLPGWEPHSYGYHGDDGHIFNGRGSGRQYGPVFGTGDWIGVIFNRVESTISYTKKGFNLGIAFENVAEEKLFPTVGFRTPGEEIIVNFGADVEAKPFRGDVAALRKEATQKLYARILAMTVPQASKRSEDVVGHLVFEYLKHHGHWDSAAAVSKDVLGGATEVPAAAREGAAALKAVVEAVVRGDVDAAVQGAETLVPGVMAAYPRVAFALQCQKLCELIRAQQDEEALAFAKTLKATNSTDDALLNEALSLFAYTDLSAAPAGHLLGVQHKAELGATLQRAVRTKLGKRELSALEDVYRQARAVHSELLVQGVPAAALADLDEIMECPADDF